MITIQDLAAKLLPARTVLFLGSGSSVTSGGLTGPQLAEHLWQVISNADPCSSDLAEVASILELNYGRDRVIGELRSHLSPLRPTGALLALPDFAWDSIYTTNYDRLVELAYRKRKQPITVIRSNFDYAKIETAGSLPLFKIHGCVSQDCCDGHRSRMILTERDYDEHSDFKEVLFKRLSLDLSTKDILIVGHSLSDRHIREEIKQAAALQQTSGAGGHIYVLLHEIDDHRAQLLEHRGVTVCFGAFEALLHALTQETEPDDESSAAHLQQDDFLETRQILSSVTVGHAAALQPDADALFHGRPATYADIASDLTFPRDMEDRLLELLKGSERLFVVITGVAGIGKSTLARRLAFRASQAGLLCWEHKPEFNLHAADWLLVEKKLSVAERRGILVVDECLESMRQVNKLARALAARKDCSLKLILTANHAGWTPRTKAPELFSLGEQIGLSQLSPSEVDYLVTLLAQQQPIRRLVDQAFTRLTRAEQVQQLRRRCSADMFVCLKNIFSFESLDTILLREFANLTEPLQEIYRHVAALEAAGAKVHRQLVLRVLNVSATALSAHLESLEGIVEEYDVKPKQGLYGWRTRHEVVADLIARYKFADEAEHIDLMRRVIQNLNPTIWLELRTISSICGREHGIGRVGDLRVQCELYRDIIRVAPGERVPRHRLISTLIRMGDLNGAELELRDAIATVKMDPPLHRYLVQSKMRRALRATGILDSDRVAMLRDAERLAHEGVERYRKDKYAYAVYGEVAEAIASTSGDVATLDAALHAMREAAAAILDPDFERVVHRFEASRHQIAQEQRAQQAKSSVRGKGRSCRDR